MCAVKIETNKILIKSKLKSSWENALPILTEHILQDSNEYVPKDQGDLEKSSYLFSQPQKGILEWSTVYAQAMWFGISSTGKDYVYSKDQNVKASKMWVENAKAEYHKDWQKMADRLFKEGIK